MISLSLSLQCGEVHDRLVMRTKHAGSPEVWARVQNCINSGLALFTPPLLILVHIADIANQSHSLQSLLNTASQAGMIRAGIGDDNYCHPLQQTGMQDAGGMSKASSPLTSSFTGSQTLKSYQVS